MINFIPKFIKLTEIYTDRTELPLLINIAFITSIKKGKNGDTMINMAGERTNKHDETRIYFFVKESVAEVEGKL